MGRRGYRRGSYRAPSSYRPPVPAPQPTRRDSGRGFDTKRFGPEREGLTPAMSAPSESEMLGQGEQHPYGGQDPFNTAWNSPADLTEYLASHTDNGRRWYAGLTECNRSGHEWAWGFQTHHALAMARTGWKSGAAQVGHTHVDVANTYLAEHTEESTRHDVTGSFVDVAAFIEGVPESMVEFCEERRETRSVKILVDSFISCGVDGDTAFRRGVTIMAAVLAAQASGLAVTVEMAAQMKMSVGGTGTYRVTVYRPGDTLDTSRLAYYLSHPAFLRNVFIQAACFATGSNGWTGDARTLHTEAAPGVVYVPGMLLSHHPWGSVEANKELITTIFNTAV